MTNGQKLAPAILLVVAACSSTTSERPRAAEPTAATAPARADHVPADARFMQHMIVHHRQAVDMTELAGERAGTEGIRLLARRILRSQEDEMARMRAWLTRRSESIPDEHAEHGAHAGMPGMATPEEMARLRNASGAGFDRLFLELMIRHHEGALTMVAELFATPGAGREPELFQFASHVDADQRMEIARMRRMLQ